MNKNIEVINKHLWALRFSLIPYIKEIDYVPDPDIPIYEEPGRITGAGLMLINKDYGGYRILKDLFPKLMSKTNKQLNTEALKLSRLKDKSPYETMYASMITVEKERRERQKGRCVKWLQ